MESRNYRDVVYKNYSSLLDMAEVFEDSAKEQKLKTEYFRKNYLPILPKDKNIRILDIACGHGAYMQACTDFGYNNVEGIDFSQSNVEFCTKRGLKCTEISFQEFLANHIAEFDVIIFNDIIEHLKKQEIVDALFLINKSLRDNGLLIVKTINAANPYTGGAGRYIVFDHETSFTEISLMQVIRACEFKEVKVLGTDIYVMGGPIAWIAKGLAKCICLWLRFVTALFGRTAIKIFDKNIIAFAKK